MSFLQCFDRMVIVHKLRSDVADRHVVIVETQLEQNLYDQTVGISRLFAIRL